MNQQALPQDLPGWLARIEALHPAGVEPGLDRVRAVLGRMGLAPAFPLITVGGTNGKGSVCVLAASILESAGYRVGLYTSPHLLAYNERVRVDGRDASDAELVEAFRRVEAARGDTRLTYFEFGTLAALWLFQHHRVDAAVLEVGLGGRLDAVNAFDADVAVVVSVDLDHMDWLGPDRESIGWEKAGIFRAGRPAICADTDPPQRLLDHAAQVGARLLLVGRDYAYTPHPQQWDFRGPRGERLALPPPALRGRVQLGNAAAAIAAVDELRERLPVSAGHLRAGLMAAEIPGRSQVLPGQPAVVLDVAHNPAAARVLAANLGGMGGGRNLAVLGMLSDKDVDGVLREMAGRIHAWHLASLPGPRGLDAQALEARLRACGIDAPAALHPGPWEAFQGARNAASRDDRIAVFGSFLTVSEILARRAEIHQPSSP